MSGQDILHQSIKKGFRPMEEAIKDDKNLRENASTGQSWIWKTRDNNIIIFN